MNIEIKTIKQVTTSKFVELPYYTKSNCHFYKVYSSTHCVCVTNLEGHYSISIIDSSIALGSSNKESNESQFKKGFEKVLKAISSEI